MARRDSPRDARREAGDNARDAKRDAVRERRGVRLDQPRDTRRLPLRPQLEDDTFGRFAERFARFMGTARFLLYMSGFVALWLVYNWLAPASTRFDPFPFIFLTLMLSLQASYAAPLILLAQNRQEDRDRVIAEGDRRANSRAHADMEFLAREMASLRLALGEVATRDYVRSELRTLLSEIDDRLEPEPPGRDEHRPRPESPPPSEEAGRTGRGRDQSDPGGAGGGPGGHVG